MGATGQVIGGVGSGVKGILTNTSKVDLPTHSFLLP
jgi:hypothetical protein